MKTTKIIYALTLLAFSSLSHAEASLESESVIAAKNRIEELRVSMINSQVELDKLKSELAALRRAGDAEFFRIKLEKQETFDIDNFRVLPLIENTEIKKRKIQDKHQSKTRRHQNKKQDEMNFPFEIFLIAGIAFGLFISFIENHDKEKLKDQEKNKENL